MDERQEKCHQHARACYITVNDLVVRTLDKMAPLIRAGAEMPDKFAATESWFKAQDGIEQAVADGNLRKVELLCAEYEQRAQKYCEGVISQMEKALRGQAA